MSDIHRKVRSRKHPFARKMKPYGEEVGSYARHEERWQSRPGTWYKASLSEWKRIRRQPKKRARQAGKDEIKEQATP